MSSPNVVRRSSISADENENANDGNENSSPNRPIRNITREENSNAEEELKYGAEHVIKLFVPVSLCMLVVVTTIKNITFYTTKDIFLVYTPFHETSPDPVTKVWNAVANSVILISIVILMTVILILLYKYRFYKVIHGWLILSSLMLVFVFTYLFFEEVLRAYNIPMDVFTLFLFSWNFGIMGMICIHWKGPLRVQQAYLIFMAALMALVFIKHLPEWTAWAVLFTVSIWDVVAVLTPRGPLRILVEMAQERNETIFPSLIYSAVAYNALAGVPTSENNQNMSPTRVVVQPQQLGDQDEEIRDVDNSTRDVSSETDGIRCETHGRPSNCPRVQRSNAREEEDRSVKLGLGDFIFYSVLVGKASSYGDWNTTIACFVAILVGLCLTLLLLARFRMALPALPISITLGLIFYFLSHLVVKPFTDLLSSHQIFI